MALRRFSSHFSVYCLGASRRGFCSKTVNNGSTLKVSLSQPLPGMPAPKYASLSQQESQTRVTTLENGMRIASENNFGSFCTIGILIDSGSRYEVKHSTGISHFLEKLAFGATDKYASRDDILQSLEAVGGICDAQGSRDTLVYAMSALNSGAEQVVEILSETVLRPKFTDMELEETKKAMKFELLNLQDTPEPEMYMVELFHKAAYRDNTLGLPRYATDNEIDNMKVAELLSYMKCYHTPERMVLAGAGVDHDSLVEYAKKHFVNKTPVWEERSDLIDTSITPDKSIAQYTGGYVTVEKDMTKYATGPSPMPNLVHGVIGLESCSLRDDDFIASCVLHSLMGGGGSFSAGGPGKGMYTRLYLNVLNKCHWMYNATAQSHVYNDTGAFCIHVSADPSYVNEMFDVIIKELLNLEQGISSIELQRAKAQLQSLLLMNLESRPVMFEDIGRQVLANNMRHSAKYYMDKIDEVSEEDLLRVVKRILSSAPSVVVLGDLKNCPTLETVQQMLNSRSGLLRNFSFYR